MNSNPRGTTGRNAASLIDAVSLQTEMSKRFGLVTQTATVKKKRKPKETIPQDVVKYCTSCRAKLTNDELCGNCGYFQPISQTVPVEDSLARRRGLITDITPNKKYEEPVLKPLDWYLMESQLSRKLNRDTCCPICMEVFGKGDEVLLSCGHIFHKICLRSFENFMKKLEFSCPICRTKNYQKKITNLGTLAYQDSCAKQIQKIWRGYSTRQEYKVMLRNYFRHRVGNNSGRRKRFFENEFTSLTSKVDKVVDTRNQQVNSMIRTFDQTIETNRQLDQLFAQMLAARSTGDQSFHQDNISSEITANLPIAPEFVTAQNVDSNSIPEQYFIREEEYCTLSNMLWKDILKQAITRGVSECAICMSGLSLERSSPGKFSFGSKGCILLSCSHCYHDRCILNFERFSGKKQNNCPVCRCPYEKRII